MRLVNEVLGNIMSASMTAHSFSGQTRANAAVQHAVWTLDAEDKDEEQDEISCQSVLMHSH